MIDYERLWRIAESRSDEYRAARPFPFVIIDNFLNNDALDVACSYFPHYDDAKWKPVTNPHTVNRVVVGSTPTGKQWPFEVECLFNAMMNAKFLHFVEKLTGVSGLISDPYFAEAGYYAMRKGGYLDIHADFSHHDRLGLERRANLLLYLNPDWKPEYNGDLVLYNNVLQPEQRIAPLLNRCVVFEPSETSYHGNPEPLAAPDGVMRRAISMWYYSLPTGRPKHRAIFPLDPTFIHYPEATTNV